MFLEGRRDSRGGLGYDVPGRTRSVGGERLTNYARYFGGGFSYMDRQEVDGRVRPGDGC